MTELLAILMFATLCIVLMLGYPVAFALAGVAIIFAVIGSSLMAFDMQFLNALPHRIFGIMENDLLIAVPLFVFMGVMLERARIAEELLETMSALFGRLRSGLGLSVLCVGALLAASTGIVGATVVTMGLISLPTMLRNNYGPAISCGTICAAGTLGQIIPPSIVLILLGDQISNAFQRAQMEALVSVPQPVSIADLFVGAIIPGLLMVALYAAWLIIYGFIKPKSCPALSEEERARIFKTGIFIPVLRVMMPPLLLIIIVLGSILSGIATTTESAAVGAVGAIILAAFRKQLSITTLQNVMRSTSRVTCMVFTILIGATLFSLVFRGYGGDDMVHAFLSDLPGGLFGAMLVTMLLMFLLGFFLDFIEITFVVVPIVAPILLMMGADPIWLAIMMAVNLQTSFLTPPFGFSLFYLRGVAPPEVKTTDIYRGVVPFVAIQIVCLIILAAFPSWVTWLPKTIYGSDFAEAFTPKTPEIGFEPYENYIDF